MSERFFGGRSVSRVDREALDDKRARGVGDVGPVFCGLESVVARYDSLHLLLLCVAVKRCVAR